VDSIQHKLYYYYHEYKILFRFFFYPFYYKIPSIQIFKEPFGAHDMILTRYDIKHDKDRI
jgi:hypothetical protein